MKAENWLILSMSLPKLEVKTLVNTLTDMLKEVELGNLASH